MAADPLKRRGSVPAERGRRGEDLACAHLRRLGFRILARNYRCRAGEIDIVARDGETCVFVEVKERSDPSHGSAIEAVTGAKRQRVVRAARLWAAAHEGSDSPVRFDVVGVDWTGDRTRIRHERGAFDADGGG